MLGSALPLESQLLSVMEGEGIRVLSADGVRIVKTPTRVEVSQTSKVMAYAARPAISQPDMARVRDAIADLDRVAVGLQDGPGARLRVRSLVVRQAEHARSPYVVSLRGVTLGSVRTVDVDEPMTSAAYAASYAEDPATANVPSLDALSALASDLCTDGDLAPACQHQFTPATFQAAYAAQYGWARQATRSVLVSFTGALVPRRLALVGSASVAAVPAPREVRTWTPPRVTIQLPDASAWSARLRFLPAALGMVGLLAVATLPANAVRFARSLELGKNAAVTAGNAGIDAAKLAAVEEGLPGRIDALRQASAQFRAADDALSSTNALAVGLAGLVPKTRSAYRTARALAEIGENTSEAGRLVATGLALALGEGGGSSLDRLQVMAAYAGSALPVLADAADAFNDVDPKMLPAEHAESAALLVGGIEDARAAVREFVGLSDVLAGILGRNAPRRYLVIFQNPSELRPTGGFMGSFAELTLDRGAIASLEVPGGGTYDVQGQLVARVVPPAPLQLIADRWEFQDSNWSPDFVAAANKIRFFWSKSGGPTMDGVIAVNATLVERLLTLTGPIAIPELDKTITSENFMLETQRAVELEYDRDENQPKKIIGLLAPRLMEQLKALPHDQSLQALTILTEALETKEIQISLSDTAEDAFADRYGWRNRLKPVQGDALAVVAANIAGQKTDLFMEEAVDHTATISENGAIEDTVVFTRSHTGQKGETFYGVRNVSYVRFYVPRGSTLVSAAGFTSPDPALFDVLQEGLTVDPDEAEIMRTKTTHPSGVDVWDEGDRTVFGGWSMVDPGETRLLTVRYRLPFTAYDIRDRLDTGATAATAAGSSASAPARTAYSLLLTSQPGKPTRQVSSEVIVPDVWQSFWERGTDTQDVPWDRDTVVAALFEVR